LRRGTGKRPLHPGAGAERAGKPWIWVRRGMIWYLIRPLCVAEFPDLGDLTITGLLCDFRYK